jgi:hypothetical protein
LKPADHLPDGERPAPVAAGPVEGAGARPVLRIYTDRRYLYPGLWHSLPLIPFWGDYHDHNGFARFAREGSEFLRLTPIEEAEVALLPFDGKYLIRETSPPREPIGGAIELARRLVEEARGAGLKTLVIVNSDRDTPLPLPRDDVVVLRTSLNRRTRGPHEFALPAWAEDISAQLGDRVPILREKRPRPSVGFCGLGATSGPRLRRRARMFARRCLRPLGVHIDHSDGLYLRRDAMAVLSRSPDVQTDFLVRPGFFGGAFDGPPDGATLERVRREYLDNLVNNDYVLNARGFGNYSFRFYETMSVGRMPLLVDTDCVLPYDFLHDYDDLCVRVPYDRLRRIADDLVDFHGRLSDEDFRDLQRRVRRFWLDWLSPSGFFSQVARHWDRRTPARPRADALRSRKGSA